MEERQKMEATELQTYMEKLVARSKAAQKYFEANYLTNRSVDEVIRAIGMASCDHAEELSRDALSETGMGNLQGKMNKLKGIALGQWTICRGQNTVDYEDSPDEPGVRILPKPMGVIGAVMPSTNPLATIIGNSMMALKGRNSIIIAPHPASVHVSERMIAILRAALKNVGAPEDLIIGIGPEAASIEATGLMLKLCDCNLATGGAGMVKAVYSSGKPGIGVGQGNCQEIFDRDFLADGGMEKAVDRVIYARNMDNGVPCACTQTDHIPVEYEEQYLETMKSRGVYIITDDAEKNKLRDLVFPNGEARINRKVVGKLPCELGQMAGIDIPESAPIILVKNQAWGDEDLLCREILCPILRYTTYEVFEDAAARAITNLETEGAGHTSCIWSYDEKHIEYVAKRIPVGRFHINQNTVGLGINGGCGITTSITIGCGTWGGNSISENITYRHLLNKTRVTTVVPNLRSVNDASWDDFEPFNRLKD